MKILILLFLGYVSVAHASKYQRYPGEGSGQMSDYERESLYYQHMNYERKEKMMQQQQEFREFYPGKRGY